MIDHASVVLFKNAFIATLSDGRHTKRLITRTRSSLAMRRVSRRDVTLNGTEAPAE